MKGRKQRRVEESLRKLESKQKSTSFVVKFQTSKDNLSCFMKPRRGNTDKNRKKTHSHRNSKQKKNPSLKKKNSKTINLKSCSPDIIHECSNKIISQIETKGLKYEWNEAENRHLQTHTIGEEFENEALRNIFASTHSKSHASTVAPQSNWKNSLYAEYSCFSCNIGPSSPSLSFSTYTYAPQPTSFTINPKSPIPDYRTTIMIRNIPNKYSISELAEQIDINHENTYDFLYLPCDPKNLCNVGYGFINFITTDSLKEFYERFEGYTWLKYRSQKICTLTYARLQGLTQLIEHFQNSKVLNQKDRRYKPIIKYSNDGYHQIHKMVKEQQQKIQ